MYFFCVMMFAHPIVSKGFLESIRDVFTFNIDESILDDVNRGILGKLTAKNIKFILPNKIEIDDVEVIDNLGARMLYAKHVKASLSLFSLITKNIRITSAHVDSPFFRYTITNDVHNVIAAFETPPTVQQQDSSSSSDIRVTIESVHVENGNFEMRHDAGVEIFAEGIVAKGKFWVENGPFGVNISDVAISKGAILTGGMDLPIANLVANDLFISDEKVSVDNLTAKYENAHLTGQGTVFIDEDRYDISAILDAPQGTYPTGLKPLPFVAPAFRAQVTMLGELVEPELLAQISLKGTDFNGLAINHGEITAQINPHQIVVENARLSTGAQGQIFAHGSVDIDKENFTFWSKEHEIFTDELAKFLSFDGETAGIINASTKLSGQFSGDDQNIRVETIGEIKGARIEKINFPTDLQFDVDINYVLDKKIAITKAHFFDSLGLQIRSFGSGNMIADNLNLNYQIFCPRLGAYYPDIRRGDDIFGVKSDGVINYDKGAISFSGPIDIQAINFAKVVASNINAQMDFADNRLTITHLVGTMHDGSIAANFAIADFNNQQLLNGEATAQAIDLSKLVKPFTKTAFGGNLSASLHLRGSLKQPIVDILSELEDVAIDKIDLQNVQLEGQVTKNQLTIAKLAILSSSGSIDGEDLQLNFETKDIAGNMKIVDFNIASAFSRYVDKLQGDVDGTINIDGNLRSPRISSTLIANKLSAWGIKMGSGPVSLSFAKQKLLGPAAREDLVFSLSAKLSESGASSMARFAIALNYQTINAEIKLDALEVNTADLPVSNANIGALFRVSGELAAAGKVTSPVFSAELMSKEYGTFDPKHREGAASIKTLHGPAVLSARSRNGQLHANLCVGLSEPKEGEGGRCDRDKALSIAVFGPFGLDEFDLNISSRVDHTHLEDVIPPLKKELITLNTLFDLNGKMAKKKGAPVRTNLLVKIERLSSSLPNIPHIVLKKPLTVTINNDAIVLNHEAMLEFMPGKLTVGGAYSRNNLDLHFTGEIPLMLTRLLLPIVQRADGLAKGAITITGTLDAPIIDGKIVPEPRSLITFRKWLEAMEIRDGAIAFHKTSLNSFVSKFENFRLGVGDGRLLLDGTFSKRYATKEHDDSSTFDLDLSGSNIVFRDRLDFVEADFNIQTKQMADGEAIAKGDIIITDGSAHRQFDLRNFVAEVQTKRSAMPKILNNVDMSLDLDIAIRQFRASARMLNLDIETILRGQLTSEGPISHPKFKGAIFVTEGAIIFPATSFDLVESQIILDENSDRSFDPKVDIVATQDLPPLRESDPETTIELTLRGDLERLNLGLRPIRGDMRLSQLKIFLLLLSPRMTGAFETSDQMELLRQGAQNAAMALSGEVFLRPLTNELQDLMEGRTKTRIQFGSSIEAGGLSLRFNWKLGPRIEIQGSYAILSDEARRQERKQDVMFDSQYSLGDLKLKLLLFDHRPLGPLSLETSFGSSRQFGGDYEPRGKIRLKYRVLNK